MKLQLSNPLLMVNFLLIITLGLKFQARVDGRDKNKNPHLRYMQLYAYVISSQKRFSNMQIVHSLEVMVNTCRKKQYNDFYRTE